MPLKNITLLHNTDELLKKFDECAKDYNYITFYCSNLNRFYPGYIATPSLRGAIMIKLFNANKDKNKQVNIITKHYIDSNKILNSKKDTNYNSGFKQTEIYTGGGLFSKNIIKVKTFFAKSPVEKFTQDIIDLARDIKKAQYEESDRNNYHRAYKFDPKEVEIKDYTEATELMVKNFKANKDKIFKILENLKEGIVKQAEYILNQEEFERKDKVTEGIKEAFYQLNKNIQDLSKEGASLTIFKELIKLIVGFFDITDPKNTFKKANLALNADLALNFAANLYDFYTKKDYYAFANPIVNLLAKEFAFIFTLVETKSLCDIVVFKSDKDSKDGYFIDFSGFDPFSDNEDVNTDEYLGICGDINDDICLFDNDTDIFKIKSNAKGFTVNLLKNDGVNDHSMYKTLNNSIASTRTNYTYIQNPHFNSFKFAKSIANKSDISKDNATSSDPYSGASKNYLIISNAPAKQNAGLSEYVITKALNYKIKDELNRTKKANINQYKDPKDFSPVKDYSKFSIEISAKDEKDTYILNLSPFVRLHKSIIDDYKQDIQDGEDALYNLDRSYDIKKDLATIKAAEEAKRNLNHINLFLKNPNDIKDIKSKEEQYLKESIVPFSAFFKNINEKTATIIRDLNGNIINIYPGYLPQEDYSNNNEYIQMPYSVIDILSLSLSFYIIKQMYDLKGIAKASQGFLGLKTVYRGKHEYISIYENEFKVLNQDAFMQTQEGKKRIFFFKQSKQEAGDKGKDALCIEEMVDEFSKFTSKDGNLFNDELYEFLNEIANSNLHDSLNEDIILNEEQKKIQEHIYNQAEESKKEYELLLQNLQNNPDLHKQALDDKKVTDQVLLSAVNDVIKDLFPFSSYFLDKNYESILKGVAKLIFNRKDLRGAFVEELGFLSILANFPHLDFKSRVKLKFVSNEEQAEKLIEKMMKKAKEKAFVGYIQIGKKVAVYEVADKSSIANAKKFNKHANKHPDFPKVLKKDVIKRHFKTTLKAAGLSIVKHGLVGIIDSLITTKFEQLKKEYQDINYKRFLHKYNDPYAVENISLSPLIHNKTSLNEKSSYLYYPMQIYSSFMSLDLKDMFIGGRMVSGGLDYHSFIYYEINNANSKTSDNVSKTLPLNKLLAYLCLDELRTTSDKNDHKYFRHLKGKEFGFIPEELKIAKHNRELKIAKSNFLSEERRAQIYEVYKRTTASEAKNKRHSPIDSYNESMEILNDFNKGIYNTDEENKPDDKARRLLKALNIIGQNNLKGIYVGCKKTYTQKTKEDIPPRLIGRLATTIIMEDGLYIG